MSGANEQQPRQVVAAAVRLGNQFILQHRDDAPGCILNPNYYSFFGGRMEPEDNGDPYEAIMRELREETSLDIGAVILLRDVYAGCPPAEQELYAYHMTLFEVQIYPAQFDFKVYEGQGRVSGYADELVASNRLASFTRLALSSDQYGIKEF